MLTRQWNQLQLSLRHPSQRFCSFTTLRCHHTPLQARSQKQILGEFMQRSRLKMLMLLSCTSRSEIPSIVYAFPQLFVHIPKWRLHRSAEIPKLMGHHSRYPQLPELPLHAWHHSMHRSEQPWTRFSRQGESLLEQPQCNSAGHAQHLSEAPEKNSGEIRKLPKCCSRLHQYGARLRKGCNVSGQGQISLCQLHAQRSPQDLNVFGQTPL